MRRRRIKLEAPRLLRHRGAGITLVEVMVALTLATGGIVVTASTLLKCSDLQAATRRATEDRVLTREVFSKLRGAAGTTEFASWHTLNLSPAVANGLTLTGGRREIVQFPASILNALVPTGPGSRFRDMNADGIVDLDTSSTNPGLYPVRVTVERAGRSVTYFSIVRTP